MVLCISDEGQLQRGAGGASDPDHHAGGPAGQQGAAVHVGAEHAAAAAAGVHARSLLPPGQALGRD